MLDIKERLSEALQNATGKGASVQANEDPKRGDYSSPVAFTIAKEESKNPEEVAKKIIEKLEKENLDFVEKIEFAAPGFINFFIKNKEKAALFNKDLDLRSKFSGKRLLIEHSSPNLFKPFHIGHMVNNFYGEALVRMLRLTGAEVQTLSFPSDVSPGIAKAVWGLKKLGLSENPSIKDLEKAYAYGVEKYEKDENARKEIDEINKELYLQQDGENLKIYQKGKELSLDFFRQTLRSLDSSIEHFVFESEAEKVGKEMVKSNTPNIFELSEGAYIFRGSEKCGLFDNVFVNSAGFGTYLAKDLGLLSIKFERFDFDLSITITDIEQEAHFKLLSCASGFINKKWQEKSIFLQHGRMRPKNGRFSSRLANVPLAQDLIDETTNLVESKMKKGNKEEARKVALAALKYAILKVKMGKTIIWDKEKALSHEGDSGPYLLYSIARVNSIFERLEKSENLDEHEIKSEKIISSELFNKILVFDEVLFEAASAFEPHKLVKYLYELAQAFSSFYSSEKIIGSDNEKEKVALLAKYRFTMELGLKALGISPVEKM